MSGALTERDFVAKLEKAGFADVEVVEREPLGIDRMASYPLFTDDLIELMHRLIPAHRHDRIVVAIVVTARNA